MPTVLRAEGLRVVIYLPPREHPPPHVHVFGPDGEVVITLPSPGGRLSVRTVAGLRAADVVRAFRLVQANAAYLLQRWGELHG